MVDTSPYGDDTLRLRIAKGEASPTVQVVDVLLVGNGDGERFVKQPSPILFSK
jgi:hypothetical protein